MRHPDGVPMVILTDSRTTSSDIPEGSLRLWIGTMARLFAVAKAVTIWASGASNPKELC